MDKFIFGIYPGGSTGTLAGIAAGAADNPVLINNALTELQRETELFLVRAYMGYKSKNVISFANPENPEQYAINGRKLDLVLSFQSDDEDLSDWLDFIRHTISKYTASLYCLQITEEANVDLPILDGHYKNSRSALVKGIVTAKAEIRRLGLDIKVGFNATPDFNPDKKFWKEIASIADEQFYMALDYVGLDFFPDVFRRIPNNACLSELEKAIDFILKNFRDNDLIAAGISKDIPLHITENGWSTGQGRSYEKQAVILKDIIQTIYKLRDRYSIAAYELFDLRDTDSRLDDIFYQFGLMRDDYTPKPAFEQYKLLIAQINDIK